MKLETELTSIDRDLIAAATEGFVPARVIDFHAHVVHPDFYVAEFISPALRGKIIDFSAYIAAIQQFLPQRSIDGALVFPYPTRRDDRPGVNRWMFADLKVAAKTHAVAGLALVGPGDDQALIAEWFTAGQCVGLKPYHLFAKPGDTLQCGVEEYAPEWMWRLCDQHRGILMLHLVKDAAALHPDNQEALLRLAQKYPACQVILAHAGRSFNHRNTRGLAALAGLANIFVDTSAITEAESLKIALATLGPARVFFGTDYPVCHFRGRCVTAGNSAQWIYADDLGNPAMTLVGIESLLSLRRAAEDLGLNAADIQHIFYDNAQAMLRFGAR